MNTDDARQRLRRNCDGPHHSMNCNSGKPSVFIRVHPWFPLYNSRSAHRSSASAARTSPTFAVAVNFAIPRDTRPARTSIVSVSHRSNNFAGDPHDFRDRELPVAIENPAERLALHIRHYVEGQFAGHARLDDFGNAGVIQVRDEADFAQKPLRRQRAGVFRTEDFHRDQPIVARVGAKIDRRHPAAPKLALETIVLGQDGCHGCGAAVGDSAYRVSTQLGEDCRRAVSSLIRTWHSSRETLMPLIDHNR